MNQSNKQLVQKVNSNKNRNTRFVKIKSDRQCRNCGKTIPKGAQALTTNKYKQGRSWTCLTCAFNKVRKSKYVPIYMKCPTYKAIMQTLAEKSCLPFDDDGACMAYDDAIAELSEECDVCNKCDFLDTLYDDEDDIDYRGRRL